MYQWLIKYAYSPNIDSNNQTNENRLGNNNVIKLPYHNAWNKLKRKKKTKSVQLQNFSLHMPTYFGNEVRNGWNGTSMWE